MALLDFNRALTAAELEQARQPPELDVEQIRQRLAAQAREFVAWLYPCAAFDRGSRIAKVGDVTGAPGESLEIELVGQKAGYWTDRAASGDEGKDLIGLYIASMGYDRARDFPRALKEISSGFFGETAAPEWSRPITRMLQDRAKVHDGKPRPVLEDLPAPSETYVYEDQERRVIGTIRRYELDAVDPTTGKPKKTFKAWDAREAKPQAPTPRPLYRIPELARTNHVVFVEGERKANALASVGVDATCVMFGSSSPLEKVDWTPIAGKYVAVWADNDVPGRAFMDRVVPFLVAMGCRVGRVPVPDGVGPKWDAADCVSEGGDPHALIARAVPIDAATPDQTAQLGRRRLLSLEEMEDLEPPEWLIDGVLPERVLSMIWGVSGSLKTFCALDMGLCIAAGVDWHGRAVKQGRVVYVAAEDPRGVAVRALGWRRTRGKDVERLPFHMWPHVVALTTDEQARELVGAILAEEGAPAFVIIDTVMATFGGGNPNQPGDMNAYVLAAMLLKERCGSHVMFVHHGGKNEEGHELGNHSLRNASDTVINVKRAEDGTIRLVNKAPKGKQKNDEEFADLRFRPVKVSFDMKGRERSTLVLNADTGPEELQDNIPKAAGEPPSKLGKVQKAVLELLTAGGRPMTFTTIKATVGSDQGAISNALKALTDRGLVAVETGETGTARLWRVV